MVVLTIIGIIVALIAAYIAIQFFNSYSMKKYKYEIFNTTTFAMSFVGYVAIFFGYDWYTSAITQHGDLLNGELLIAIGVIFLLSVVYLNITNTSLFYGIVMSIVVEIFYLVATPPLLIFILLGIAYFSETKPVINVN